MTGLANVNIYSPQFIIIIIIIIIIMLKLIVVILPVFLYECETWSVTLREERLLKVYENRFLRRIFGPTREEVIGG
jgi:hypothetical protein